MLNIWIYNKKFDFNEDYFLENLEKFEDDMRNWRDDWDITPENVIEIFQSISVYASGEELKFIKEHFHNIPFTSADKVHWMGNDAYFIVSNLIELTK
jgi:hypothetical protein